MCLCLLGSRVPRRLTNGVFRIASMARLGAMFTLMCMNIVVKSRKKETLIDDLKETFDNLRVYNMMLNPAKCVFGVPAGKLLGFLVSERGIEANPEKIKAITSLAKPACINDVQRLAGRIAALSRLGEKAMPLYQLMKKTDNFV